MKVLLLVDKLRWSYAAIAQALEKYNPYGDLKLHTEPIKKNEKHIKKIYKKYDRFFVFGWQTYERINFLPKKQTLIGIHSYHGWDDRKTTPDNKNEIHPPRKLVDFLNGFPRVNAVSKQLTDVFQRAGVKKIVYTPNGVDVEMFKPMHKPHRGFVVGYSGSKAHDWRKGVSQFIKPATKKARVDLKIAMLSSGDYIDLKNMPAFYNELDTYVCASSSEGFSLSVLEAAACGCPIISTKVGGCVNLIQDGKNGFLVDRDVNAIKDKIVLLKENEDLRQKISEQMVKDVKKKWSWSIRATDWINFIRA